MMRLVLLGAGLIVGVLVIGAIAVDEGEVVTLTTLGEEGDRFDTQLWIVDLDDGLYVRSGSEDSGWLKRLRDHPDVELKRNGARRPFVARPVDEPSLRSEVNRAMAAKYGASDRFWSWLFDRRKSVPVRLKPPPEETQP